MSTRTPAPPAPVTAAASAAHPGPWTVHERYDHHAGLTRLSIRGDNGGAVVEISGATDRTRANARLIAAAPQLRDALAALLASVEARDRALAEDVPTRTRDEIAAHLIDEVIAEDNARALLATLTPTPGGSTDGR